MNALEAEIRRRGQRAFSSSVAGSAPSASLRYMVENAPGEDRLVVSVEEDAGFCAETRAVLAELGLEQAASVHHMPLTRQRVGGREVTCYHLSPAVVGPTPRWGTRIALVGHGLLVGEVARAPSRARPP